MRDPRSALVAAAQFRSVHDAVRFIHGFVPPAESHRRTRDATEVNPVRRIFDAHTSSRRVYKWRHYFDAYQRHFSRFVGTEVHILEIGVFDGGSLEMWREYFGPRAVVYGVEIDPESAKKAPPFAKVFVGDQSDPNLWARVRRELPRLDIVVDDGGHTYEQQRTTFEELFSHLSDEGVYCCEDIHGTRHEVVGYFARLARELHAMDLESPPDHDGRMVVRPTPVQRAMGSVHIYPFMTVVERAGPQHERFIAEKKGTLAS